MRLEQIVAHGYDIIDGQLGGGVGIQHGGLADGLLLAGHGNSMEWSLGARWCGRSHREAYLFLPFRLPWS